MSEVLHIKNFGPIKDVKVDLKKFNVIIGENATGKSTIAKVLAVCRYFSYIYGNAGVTFSQKTSPFFQGLLSWGLGELFRKNSYINYECDDYSFRAEIQDASLHLKNEENVVAYTAENNEVWEY
ncbi:MAG: AAA family ATPase [Ferruginibacter sp.]